MTTIKSFIGKRPLILYFILTFVISWGAILIIVGPGGIPVTIEQIQVVGAAILLGPSVAGILLTGLIDGKAGFRELLSRLRKWRVDIRWYAVALLTAPLVATMVLLALSLRSPEFRPAIFTSGDKSGLLLGGIIGGLVVGIFEELGWTGFAVPRLRPHHRIFTTGLIVGILWGAWHFILFWQNDSFSQMLPFGLLLGRLFFWLPAFRILMVWVYDHTKSLLVAMLMHASLSASTLVLPSMELAGTALLTWIVAWAAALWLVVAVVAVASRKQFSQQPLPQAAD